MVSTALAIEPFTCIDPYTACWVLEPALLALILSPTLEANANLEGRSGRSLAFQNGHQPSAQSAVGVIIINLIRRALLELGYDIVEVTVVRLGLFRRRVKCAFNP